MMTERALYTLWMTLCGHPYSVRVSRLITKTAPEELYQMTRREMIPLTGEKDADLFLNKDLSPARKILYQCQEKGIDVTCYHDPDFPPLLREIPDPPALLFHYGPMPDSRRPSLGIVGTRHCSRSAAERTVSFSCSLAMSGFQIISGMADGIDTCAHEGPLYRNLPSFAVLGCGVDVIYPKKNRALYEILKQHGTLISEYLPGTQPAPSLFPRRNRIISGISEGVIVMECPKKSGAMITARYAAEQNRVLFAVPTAADDNRYPGTNFLIKHGAVFCTEPADVINEFYPRFGHILTPVSVRFPARAEKPADPSPERIFPEETPKEPVKTALSAPTLSPEEKTVYDALSDTESRTLDEISALSGIPVFRLLPLLQALEFTDAVVTLPGAAYRRK